MKYSYLFTIVLLFIFSCGGGSSNDSPDPNNDNNDDPEITLDNVPDYQLENTEALLSDIETALTD